MLNGEDEDLSYTDLIHQVNFSVLSYNDEDEELFPISDEKYAELLHFQEILMSSVVSASSGHRPSLIHHLQTIPTSSVRRSINERDESSSTISSLVFCKICMEAASKSEMFESKRCAHIFCQDCLSQYIVSKVKESISMVKCPEVECKAVLEPEFCQDLISEELFEWWDSVLCEYVIFGAHKLYCSFKDCSVILVDEGVEKVTQSECPSCRRLFCAHCLVAWHSGVSCEEYVRLPPDEKGRSDMMLIEVAKSKNWMRCPVCKFYVEKTDGCQHITCRCGFHFLLWLSKGVG